MAGLRIPMRAADVPAALRRRNRATLDAIALGTRVGAQRGRTLIVRKTPTDQGQLRASWSVAGGQRTGGLRGRLLAELFNDAPHAGIIERGARPHSVNRAGIEALTQWVWRKRRSFGIVTASGNAARGKKAQAQARAIAFAIARKIAAKGQVGQFFVRKNKPALEKAMIREVRRALRKSARRRVE